MLPYIEQYVFTYLKNFPPNTFALPQTFRKVVKGLNASHWLAKKVMELKDRRWRNREGIDTPYGRMTEDEVEKIKACNLAFWECYINQRPSEEVLNKKRQQYARKTEHNKTSRVTKKSKLGGESSSGGKSNEDETIVPQSEIAAVPVPNDSSVLDPTNDEIPEVDVDTMAPGPAATDHSMVFL
jgi:hypothetical protein